MKYGYEGVELGELIQNYKISNDKIIITFLDGSNYEMPLTEKNEKALLNQMIQQAQERRESQSLYDAKQKRDKALIRMMPLGTFIMIIIASAITDLKNTKFLIGALSGITAIPLVTNGLAYKYRIDEIKELEKYDIYLSIAEKLENITDPNLFNGVTKQEEAFNINTLDNYSLSDIKKIRDNLKRSEKYASKYYDKIDSNPILTKKIGK